jgi:hypothetical protein
MTVEIPDHLVLEEFRVALMAWAGDNLCRDGARLLEILAEIAEEIDR